MSYKEKRKQLSLSNFSSSDSPYITVPSQIPKKFNLSKYTTRPPLSQTEHFPYYDRPYNPNDSFSNEPKQWKRIIGGSLSRSKRKTNPIYDHIKRENVPGPGNYNPKLILTRPMTPSYKCGIRREGKSDFNVITGTSVFVGPGKYFFKFGDEVRSDFRNSPLYSIGRSGRKPLYGKIWTRNEMYFLLPAFRKMGFYRKDFGGKGYFVNNTMGNRGFSAKVTGQKKVFL